MPNSLTIYKTPEGRFKIEFYFIDGCTMWELYDSKFTEIDILVKLIQLKFYNTLPGSWNINLPMSAYMFSDDDFDKAVQSALRYIYERDNPEYPDVWC